MESSIDRVKREIIKHCRACRFKAHKTQKELSNCCGIHYSTLSMFENGRFSFEVAKVYYDHVMTAEEQNSFRKLVDYLKETYLMSRSDANAGL